MRTAHPPTLGLRQNVAQFTLLVGVNALVGGMIGQERTVLPLLAEHEFGLTAFTAALTFIVAFGLCKAATNFFAGTLSDRYGRKPVLVAGWLIGVPVPLLLMWAPTWGWVIAANVLLGINQGLTWSTTVIMKIDLVGPARRGFAMGLNEAAGYGAVAVTALATGYIADALRAAARAVLPRRRLRRPRARPVDPVRARDPRTTPASRREPRARADGRHDHLHDELATGEVFVLTSFREPALSSGSQAGLVNNLNDGLAWGLLPDLLRRRRPRVGRIGVLAALYPAVWGLGQLVTGGSPTASAASAHRRRHAHPGRRHRLDRRRRPASPPGRSAPSLLGAGTAMVYPTLLAAIGDVAHPAWRARSVGVYRLWRDGGFAVGALLAGVLADLVRRSTPPIWAVAALTAASGLRRRGPHVRDPPAPGAHAAPHAL